MGTIQEVKNQDLNDPDLIIKLESCLKDSKVLTPSSDEYGTRIKRWSSASEKRAVSGFFAPIKLSLISPTGSHCPCNYSGRYLDYRPLCPGMVD